MHSTYKSALKKICAVGISTLAFVALSAGTAFAGVGVGVAPNFPGTVTVGQTGVAVSMDVTNTSNGGVTNIDLSNIRLIPSCGDTDLDSTTCVDPVGEKDPGVFTVSSTATGSNACAANTFTVAVTDASTGQVTFTPNSTITLALGAVCTINFTVNVNKTATNDGDAGLTGIQTLQIGKVTGTITGNGLNSTGAGSDETVVNKASPTISTTPGAGGPIGTTLTDTATISGGSSPLGTVTFKLFPPSDASCSGAAVDTESDANAPYATPAGFVSNATGVWHWTAHYAGDANNNPADSLCADETATITKLNPTVSTDVHNAAHAVITSASLGDTVHDKAHVAGSGPVPTGTVDFEFYGPGTTSCLPGDPQVSAGSHALDGSGDADGSSNEGPLAAGNYSFQAHYEGDANYNAADGPCEPLTVSKATPLPLTEIHNAAEQAIGSSAPANTTVHDKATVGGVVNAPIPGGTVDFTFYTGTLACDNTGAAAGTGVALDVSGIAHPSSSEGPLAAGSYSFKAHYSGDANYSAADAPCEPLTISKLNPTNVTEIHNVTNHAVAITTGAPGISVDDKATVGGTGPVPSGNVDFTFFPNASCTPATGSAAGTVALVSGVAHPSSVEGPLAAGSYSFLAHYEGDSFYNTKDAACEPLTISKASPTLGTTPNPASGNVGAVLNDTATLSGANSPTGNIVFNLYPPSDASCAGVASYNQSVSLSGNNAATSPGFTSNAAGTWHWTASYAGDTNNNSAASGCQAEPVTLTQPVAQYCSPGYWKQSQHFDSWKIYATTDLFSTVFGVNPFDVGKGKKGANDPTLLEALNGNGGGISMLARAAVDGLLNSTSMNSGLTSAQVITIVKNAIIAGNNQAYTDAAAQLTAPENCPLN